jgi:hypothetical protein
LFRGLVGSEMCIRDRHLTVNQRVLGSSPRGRAKLTQ